MIGRAMLTCDIDERWNGPPPKCEGTQFIHSSSYSFTTINTSQIKKNIIKSNQFFFFHSPIKKSAIECDELPEIYDNAKIIATNGSFYGARAEIVCPPGHKTSGPKLITCLATGQWSSPLSSCIRGKLLWNRLLCLFLVSCLSICLPVCLCVYLKSF